MNINKVEISGGLIRDAELRFLPSGVAVVEFTIATNGARYDSKSREQVVTTQFTTVEAWAWLAEQVGEMGLVKGEGVYVLGELTQQEREKQDGTKERKTRVRAAMVQPFRRRAANYSPPQQDSGQWGGPPPQQGSDPWAGPPQPPQGGAYDSPPF